MLLRPLPYPLLVTAGALEDDATCLLNLENPTINRAAATGGNAVTGRVTHAGKESWAPRVLVVVNAHDHPVTTATSVIISGPTPPP